MSQVAVKRAALRLAAPEVAATPAPAFDYSKLSELHYALSRADDAVQMARGCPRIPATVDYYRARDAIVIAALEELRKVLGNG